MLDNRRSIFDMAARRDVVDPKANEIASAQLAINGEVEQRKIALTVLNLKSDPNGPDLFRPKGTLLANEPSFVPGDTGSSAIYLDCSGHGRPPRPTAPTAAPTFSRPAMLPQLHRTRGTFPLNSRYQTESVQRLNAEIAPGAVIPFASQHATLPCDNHPISPTTARGAFW
jgi:hypothetical protein